MTGIDISPPELQLTQEGYFRMFEIYLEQTKTMREAYHEVESYCERKGYSHRYSSFETFQRCYYRAIKNRRI